MAETDSLASDLQHLTLDYYHCSFFFPLIPNLGKDLPPLPDKPEHLYTETGATRATDEERAAYHYFTPILRNVLFKQSATTNDQALIPLQEWRLNDIADWRLTLKQITGTSGYVVPDKTVKFESLRLYRYFNGLQLLAFTVKPADHESMIMEDWLHFTRLARQLYPTFVEQSHEKKIAPLVLRQGAQPEITALNEDTIAIPPPQQSSHYLSPIIQALVTSFYTEQQGITQWLEQDAALYDDRMFISVVYGVPEEILKCSCFDERSRELCKNRLNQIQTLVAYTDRGLDAWVNGYPYDPSYIENDLKNKKFSLWEQAGTTYFYTDVVNAALGGGWFFNNIIAPKHIPNIYDRMLIQALFYQASLRYYDQTITLSTTQLLKHQQTDEIKQQYAQFIQFTNQYWFSDLTQQMQGKAIGRLQQQGLELKAHYDRILDELNRTSDFLQAKQELEIAKTSKNLTKYGAIFAASAIYLALVPILLEHCQDWDKLIILLIIIPCFLGLSFYLWVKHKSHQSESAPTREHD